MARFHGGKFGTYEIRVKPVGWRVRFPYEKWSPPYLVGSKVEFEMELIHPDARLFNLAFYVIYTASQKGPERISIESDKQASKMIMDRYSAPQEGALQIWLGTPEGPESVNMVNAEAWNPTTTFISLASVIVGIIATKIVEWLWSLF